MDFYEWLRLRREGANVPNSFTFGIDDNEKITFLPETHSLVAREPVKERLDFEKINEENQKVIDRIWRDFNHSRPFFIMKQSDYFLTEYSDSELTNFIQW